MPRLLILCEFPTLLGGERSMLSTLSAIRAAGFDVHIAAPPAGPLATTICEAEATHIDWSVTDERGVRRPLCELRAHLDRFIRRIGPALVHGNSLSISRVAGPVTSALGISSIGHLRDIIKVSEQSMADLNCHRRLVAVSRATRDFHSRHGLDAAKCIVIHNGVDLDVFQPRPVSNCLHRELALPPAARLVATIGQLGPRKGTDIALAAAQIVARKLPDLHWLVVGERTSDKDESRDFERHLHELAAAPPLAGRVHFLGQRNDIPQVLNECTLLVQAARQEPLARVLLEAAASGLAAIATDVGGTREIFPADDDGALLVAPDEPSALAEAIDFLCTDDARRHALDRAARQRAEAAFDVRAAASRLVEQYQSLV
jgi:glycosyltransferase involved in cell wall biosynthesis